MAKYTTKANPDKKTWAVISKDKAGKDVIAYGKHPSFENAAKHAVACNAIFGDR